MKQQTLTPEQLSMLKEITNPVIRRRFALFHQMPSDLQEEFFAEKTTDTIWSTLRDGYGLADSNLIAVSRIVGLVMLGELPLKDFIRRLAQDLDIESSLAAKIAQDINQLIFQPVRESLMAVHGLRPADTDTRINANNADMRIKDKSGLTQDNAERTRTEAAPTTKAPEPKPFDAAPSVKLRTSQDKPVSLQELDKRPAPARPMPTVQPKPQPVRSFDNAQDKKPEPVGPPPPVTEEKEERRPFNNVQGKQELIERLKQKKKLNRNSIETHRNTVDNYPNNKRSPKATTTAWNGRTIDLTKIPPRREVNGNGKQRKNGVRYLDPKDLYEV